jgi:hypothetical protein
MSSALDHAVCQQNYRYAGLEFQLTYLFIIYLLLHLISPANVVGKEHWNSDKLTVRGMVAWRHTMVRIPAGAKCEWWWARATTLIKTLCQKETTVGVGPSHGQAVHTPRGVWGPFLNPPPVHWW